MHRVVAHLTRPPTRWCQMCRQRHSLVAESHTNISGVSGAQRSKTLIRKVSGLIGAQRSITFMHEVSGVAAPKCTTSMREASQVNVVSTRVNRDSVLLNVQRQCTTNNEFVRFYSKKYKGGKGGEKKTSRNVSLAGDDDLTAVIDVPKMKGEMEGVIADLRNDFLQHVTLHLTIGSFNNLMIITDDGKFPLNQLGQIIQKSPQLIQINMVSAPQYIKPVMTTIIQSGMGINPQHDKDSIFLQLPSVTREQREKLAQSTKTLCNKAKDKLRDVHNKYSKKLKQGQGSHSEDLIHNLQTEVHNNMLAYTSEAEKVTKAKQDELLQKK